MLKQKRLVKAREHFQKGDLKRATIELRDALKIDPKFAEAADLLAEINFKQGNYQNSYRLLQHAAAAKPEYIPAHKGLAQIYRLAGKLSEAQTEAEFVLQRDPKDIDARLNLATVQRAQNKLAEAENNFKLVLTTKPGQVDALLALASMRQKASDLPAGENHLRTALAFNPQSLPVYLALISFYTATNRSEKVEPLFADALRAMNNDPVVLQAQANYYVRLRNLTKAEDSLKKMQTIATQNPLYWGALGDFYAQRGAWDKAKAEYERILKQHPGEPGTTQKLIEVHLTLNERNAAESLNETVLSKNPKDTHAHLVKGRFYLADGDIEKALLHFNKVKEYQVDMPALHYWYAQAHQQKGQLTEAKQELQTALKYDPEYLTARLNLAALQNRSRAFEAALEDVRKALSTNPGDASALLVYSRTLMAKRDYVQAAKVLKVALQAAPASLEVHRQLSVLQLANKNMSGAQHEFEEAWKLQPGAGSLQPLLESILRFSVTNRQIDGALDFLRRQLGHSQDAMLHHEMAQLYLLQNKREEGIASLAQSLTLAPENIPGTLLLADLHVAANQPEPAVQLLKGIIHKHPKNADLLVRVGVLFERLQRWDEARSAYERALQLNGNNPITKNNLAWLLVEHGGNVDVALDLAQQAKSQMGGDLQVTNTIGWIYYKKGIYRTALTYLKECADRDQRNPTFQYQLGLAYSQVGDRYGARRSLMNALNLNPKFPEAELARAALARL